MGHPIIGYQSASEIDGVQAGRDPRDRVRTNDLQTGESIPVGLLLGHDLALVPEHIIDLAAQVCDRQGRDHHNSESKNTDKKPLLCISIDHVITV